MTPSDLLLKSLADNPALLDAVKAALLAEFDTPPELHVDMGDTLLGQIFRAQLIGREKVEAAFKGIARLATSQEATQGVNRAR